MDIVVGILNESLYLTKEIAIYLIFGFLFAGLLKAFISEEKIVSFIGKPGLSSVFKASLIGTPLPLCSCSVLPIAYSLRKKGASKGAVSSFLVSTPEIGVDSIILSYTLLGPVFAIVRPISAFTTALFSGIFQNTFNKDQAEIVPEQEKKPKCSCGKNHSQPQPYYC